MTPTVVPPERRRVGAVAIRDAHVLMVRERRTDAGRPTPGDRVLDPARW